MTAIPLKTVLLVPGDDIVQVARDALGAANITPDPGDVLCVCESPLAITQGRIVHVDHLHPGIAARILCRLFDANGSLATAYGMQVAIDQAGLVRILAALAAGVVGKLAGRRGDFYRVAGRQVAWIDDVTGTMPPYTQDIVLGPADPDGVAERVGAAVGCQAAVVDANDLGRVEIMGATPGINRQRLADAIRHNPQGNDDEQTPLVLVRAD